MSLAILARKQREKQNISRGQFNVNGMLKASARHRASICEGVLPTEDVVAVSVKNTRFANHRNVLTRSCFNGREGYICQRVWDGKKPTNGVEMSSGDSISSSQHLENLRSSVTQCGNRVFNTLPANFTLSGVILEEEITVTGVGGKFAFDGAVYDVANGPFVLTNGIYTFKDIPSAHPIAFLNNGISNITYLVDDSTPIDINVVGGNQTPGANVDYYDFTDSNGDPISILNGDYRFMRGRTYQFNTAGVDAAHPFKINLNGQEITPTGNLIVIHIPHDQDVTADTIFYQCGNHVVMKGIFKFLNSDVTGSLNDGNYDFYYGDVTLEVTGDFGSIGYACYFHAGMLQDNGIQYQKPAQITKDTATNETTVSINGVTATLPCMAGNIISGNDYIIKSIANNRITVENRAGNVISFTNNDVAVTVTAGCNVSVDSNGNVVTSKYNESGNKKHPYKCKTTTVTKQVLSKQIDDYSDYMDRIRQRAIKGR